MAHIYSCIRILVICHSAERNPSFQIGSGVLALVVVNECRVILESQPQHCSNSADESLSRDSVFSGSSRPELSQD